MGGWNLSLPAKGKSSGAQFVCLCTKYIFPHCFQYFHHQLWHCSLTSTDLDKKVSDKKVWLDINEDQQWTATRVYWPRMNALRPVIRVSRGRVNSNCLVVTVWWRVGTSFTHAEINWMSSAFELLCHCSHRLWCRTDLYGLVTETEGARRGWWQQGGVVTS